MIIDYDSIFLEVKDMERSRRFYEQLFELQATEDLADFGLVSLNVGNQGPRIVLRDSNCHGIGQPTIWFKVDNVNKLYQKFSSSEVEFITEPFQVQNGWAVEFYDPAGNRLGITDCKKNSPFGLLLYSLLLINRNPGSLWK